MDRQDEDSRILEKDVLLKLGGFGKNFGVPEGVEIMYPGRYFYKNGCHYVLYDESSDEVGKTLDTKCILKITDSSVEVIKHGAVNTDMVLAVGNPSVSIYQTAFGELSLATNVRELTVTKTDHLLKADVLYTLEINNDYAEECHLVLTVTD